MLDSVFRPSKPFLKLHKLYIGFCHNKQCLGFVNVLLIFTSSSHLVICYYQYYYYYVTLYSFPIVFSLFLGCRIENCDTCYSRTFCSRCQPPYVGLYGKCVLQCPDSMYVNEMTSQCEVKGEIKWDFEIGCAGGKLPIISHIFTTIIRLNWTFKLSYGIIFTEIAPTMTNLLFMLIYMIKVRKNPSD